MKIEGKVAVVTGAASGLGYASACALAGAGASIVAIDLDAGRMARLRDAVPADRLLIHAASVADAQSVAAAIDAAVARFGAVHIAVNCAGVADAAKTVSKGEPFPLATWDKVIAVNLTGTFNVIRLAAARMVGNTPGEDGERGVIVNTSSGAAWQGQMGQAAYSASKAGVMGLTLPVARDLAPHGIRVVSIAPGLFDTAMVAGMPENVSRAIIDRMVLFPNRMGRADEFAALVRTIVENAYFNATTISLDAGARMSSR
ncbi:MAG TPA: SDR family NAD(P)-dependent oxidoreductase [Quisquiliibacterium sp.]|jgi:NAD(P)-dependent dehydrogenase (short-subunit alcohol dehydrogenase family)|nr:MAG: SDR family NAD(P)-dependent oxidoreductase [Burkholderiaceae bacterium]HOA95325.1 SDR family NAD(P)-dependent oxidoreductase [Quisquiliibacterium sp.]